MTIVFMDGFQVLVKKYEKYIIDKLDDNIFKLDIPEFKKCPTCGGLVE